MVVPELIGNTISSRDFQCLLAVIMRGLMIMRNKLLSSMNISCLITLSQKIISRSTPSRFLCLKADGSSGQLEENGILVNALRDMGVDIQLVRKRQPGVLRKKATNEDDLSTFLHAKGFARETIATIISRYPRCITRSHDSLQKRWGIWQNILKSDPGVAKILERSPECFFRSGNNENTQKNVTFFSSLGLTASDLAKMLTIVPRAFSNSVELNKQTVDLLRDIYVDAGGEDPAVFLKKIISKNPFILLRSSKQVIANVELLKSNLNLEKEQLRKAILCGEGVHLLHLSTEYVKKNFANIKQKLLSLGCTETEVIAFLGKRLRVLYLSAQKMNDKIDLLLQANINLDQILKHPLILDKSIETISGRIDVLRKQGYDFETQTIGILELSAPRFEAKFGKMCS